jgi:hypothetical protein
MQNEKERKKREKEQGTSRMRQKKFSAAATQAPRTGQDTGVLHNKNSYVEG